MGEEWRGGDINLFAGGGQKVNILLRDLEKYKNDDKKIILFTDRYSFGSCLFVIIMILNIIFVKF